MRGDRERERDEKEKQKVVEGKRSTVRKCIILINNNLQFFMISLGGM